jgi:ubiquinone/menaquinone biosynthesis C-methylase UbiE
MNHETRTDKSIDYDKVSRVYDNVRVGNPEMVHQLLQGANINHKSLVLDVGCGTGNNTLLFAEATHAKVTGLDISYGMLEKAKKKAEWIQLVQGIAGSLPFSNEVFQFAFMTEVLHHLPDISQALSEIFRVLELGGSICIVTQSHKQIDCRMTSRFFPASARVDKERYPDIDVIEENLTKTGFRGIVFKEYQFQPTRLGKDYLETVTNRGYSMLHKIGKDEYDRGLEDLRTAFAKGEDLIYSAGYTFLWATRD